MGIWSKVKKAIAVATTVAPILPIPAKAKRIIAKVGETEEDVEAIVHEVKPATPKPPTRLPLVLACLLGASSAFAQQPIPVPYPTPATYQLCWDHDGVNTDGFIVQDGATRIGDVRPARNAQTPFYCIPFPALTPPVAGVPPPPHPLTVTAYNVAGRALDSDPLTIVLVLVPARVTNLQARPGQ